MLAIVSSLPLRRNAHASTANGISPVVNGPRAADLPGRPVWTHALVP